MRYRPGTRRMLFQPVELQGKGNGAGALCFAGPVSYAVFSGVKNVAARIDSAGAFVVQLKRYTKKLPSGDVR